MSVQTQTGGAFGRFEAEVTHTVLRRCAKCESPHPAALGIRDTSKCHTCGEPAARPVSRTERSGISLKDPFLLMGQACLMLAGVCRRFIERLDK